jgi:hypothetical protein
MALRSRPSIVVRGLYSGIEPHRIHLAAAVTVYDIFRFAGLIAQRILRAHNPDRSIGLTLLFLLGYRIIQTSTFLITRPVGFFVGDGEC